MITPHFLSWAGCLGAAAREATLNIQAIIISRYHSRDTSIEYLNEVVVVI